MKKIIQFFINLFDELMEHFEHDKKVHEMRKRINMVLDGLEWKIFKTWIGILLHHSFTKDGIIVDTIAIKKYHTSWRYNNNIIIHAEAQELMKAGKSVTPPWQDIGYHFTIETVNGIIHLFPGRSMRISGAHEVKANSTHIGICNIGNFDEKAPSEDLYLFTSIVCQEIMKRLPTIVKIEGHNQYKSSKTCPGKQYDVDKIDKIIKEA